MKRYAAENTMRLPIAVTTYFNPFRGRLRRRNYDVFRRELGLPLLTVEWSPEGRFELEETDADMLLQISGGDLLWQKERLLNIGMAQALATWPQADLVFVDCDVVFADPGWSACVVEALDRFPAVQCFDTVGYLPENTPLDGPLATLAQTPAEISMPSLASALEMGRRLYERQGGVPAELNSGSPMALCGNPGMAIALRPGALPGFRFYERNLVGGGDLPLAAALAGRLEEVFAQRAHSPAHRDDLRDWARQCIPPGPGLGCAPQRLLHLWHGRLEDRGYVKRYAILLAHGFDPARDLDPDPAGGLRLLPHAQALRLAVADYLASRNDA